LWRGSSRLVALPYVNKSIRFPGIRGMYTQSANMCVSVNSSRILLSYYNYFSVRITYYTFVIIHPYLIFPIYNFCLCIIIEYLSHLQLFLYLYFLHLVLLLFQIGNFVCVLWGKTIGSYVSKILLTLYLVL